MSRKREFSADFINMMLETATQPSWHSRQGGWAVWSLEYDTPVYHYVMWLGKVWKLEGSLAGRLQAVRPYLPHDVYKRMVIYATQRWAKYLPPVQFRDGLIVEVHSPEATVVLPDPTNLSLTVPAPERPSRLLHVFLNYPKSPSSPVKVLSVWIPQENIQALIRNVILALPRGKPSRTIGKLVHYLSQIHPEDLGVIGPWDNQLLCSYLVFVAETIRNMDQDSLDMTVSKYSEFTKKGVYR